MPPTSPLERLGWWPQKLCPPGPSYVHVVSFGKSVIADGVTDLKMRSWMRVALNPVTSSAYERREGEADTGTRKSQVKMEQDWRDVATSQGRLSHQNSGEAGKTPPFPPHSCLGREHGPANIFFETSGLRDCDSPQVFSNCLQPWETYTLATTEVPLNSSLSKDQGAACLTV